LPSKTAVDGCVGGGAKQSSSAGTKPRNGGADAARKSDCIIAEPRRALLKTSLFVPVRVYMQCPIVIDAD